MYHNVLHCVVMTTQDRASESSQEQPGRSRKQRVLHTRISEQLAEDLRRIADDLRVPVSNLVRNALEEAFSVVETVTDNVGDFVGEVVEEAERARQRVRSRRPHRRRRRRPSAGQRPEPETADPGGTAARPEFPSVIGWQPLILNQRACCADCQAPLVRGEQAFAGLTAEGPSAIFLCSDCTDERR
jgi:hypothetical protein